jgi:dienelactone hydrolase
VPATTLAPGTLTAIDTNRRYAVGTSQATFVDSSRSTSANGDFAGAATRTIPVEFFYPADGQAGGDSVTGAAPDKAHGPYPLILFSHGYAVTPDFYRPLLERWAAAGYVVAAPVYPILSGTPGGASHTDYEKTFDDARFVISQVLALPGNDPLGGLVDGTRIAAAGHSDGEVVAFGEGLLQCCRDDRVRSVIAMAGDLSNASNPHVGNSGVPILHVMETEDEYDPYQHSIDWDRANLDAPRWMLSLLGASHVPPYTQPGNAAFELVSATTIAFFDGTLKGHPERLDAIAATVDSSNGVASLER